MGRFVSTYTNKIDGRGRVSLPPSFRDVLARIGYPDGRSEPSVYCHPAIAGAAIDAGGESLARTIDHLLQDIQDYSDERDQLSLAFYGAAEIIDIEGEGRIVLPEKFRVHAGIETAVTFVGLGQKFQMWEPKRFAKALEEASSRAADHRRLLSAGRRSGADEPGGGGEGARG
jgi:MraZ protein